MNGFFHHVGRPGSSDFAWTVERRRSIQEFNGRLEGAPEERAFFQNNPTFRSAFPEGSFNCWGVPDGAQQTFTETSIGDLVLLVHSAGVHGRGIEHIGVVKAKAPEHLWAASDILWPQWQGMKKFPWLFFFDTETGHLPWAEFLNDMGYSEAYRGGGLYQRIAPERLVRWGGSAGYLVRLRNTYGFRRAN